MTRPSGSVPTLSPDATGPTRPTNRPRAAVVEHHLRRLGSDDLAALVADLWAGRGFETSRDGQLVVATRGGVTERIAVVGRRRLGTPSLSDHPADVIVAPGGATVDPATGGHRTLGADDLREMLFYAVDRPTSRQLCERHLGEPPEQLRPPLAARLRRRSQTVASRVTPALALGLIVLFGIGAVAGVALTPEMAGQNGSDEVEPPGVTDGGIANLSALAAAHERVVTGQSYTLRLEPARPVKTLWGGDRRTIGIAVDGDRYLLAETRERPDELRSVREVYYNSSTLQIAVFDENGTIESVRQRQVGESSTDRSGPNPFELRETLFTRYLSTPETTVTDHISKRNRTVTRIVARGTPAGFEAERVRNYTAVALVDDRGFLRNLTVEYNPATGPPNYTIRFEARYGNLGETDVQSPWWHGRPLPRFRGLPSAEESD